MTKMSLLVSSTSYSLMMLWWLMNFKMRISRLTFVCHALPWRSCACLSSSVCLWSWLLREHQSGHALPLASPICTFDLCKTTRAYRLAQDVVPYVDLVHEMYISGNTPSKIRLKHLNRHPFHSCSVQRQDSFVLITFEDKKRNADGQDNKRSKLLKYYVSTSKYHLTLTLSSLSAHDFFSPIIVLWLTPVITTK